MKNTDIVEANKLYYTVTARLRKFSQSVALCSVAERFRSYWDATEDFSDHEQIARLLLGVKVTESKRARERKFQGANWPGSYWLIWSWEQIGPGANRLWIGMHTHTQETCHLPSEPIMDPKSLKDLKTKRNTTVHIFTYQQNKLRKSYIMLHMDVI